MINPAFYKRKNLVTIKGKAPYYPQRLPTIVPTTQSYQVQFGDTYYSIARRLFGEDRQHLWTIIADINPPTYPDELEVGRTILLPKSIVQDATT